MPYAPGGASDILARLIQPHLERALGQSFVVDNRGGGASQVGTQAIATAAPDGYTIGVIDSAFVINPGLFAGKLPYDTQKDFAPVSLLATTPLVLVVHPSVPAATAQELVALAKAKPGEVTFASAGLGTAIHLAGEQFRQVARRRDQSHPVSRRRAFGDRSDRRQGELHVLDHSVDPWSMCAADACARSA